MRKIFSHRLMRSVTTRNRAKDIELYEVSLPKGRLTSQFLWDLMKIESDDILLVNLRGID